MVTSLTASLEGVFRVDIPQRRGRRRLPIEPHGQWCYGIPVWDVGRSVTEDGSESLPTRASVAMGVWLGGGRGPRARADTLVRDDVVSTQKYSPALETLHKCRPKFVFRHSFDKIGEQIVGLIRSNLFCV